MNLHPCDQANSILESDLELAVKQETLVEPLHLMETKEGIIYVVVYLQWANDKAWYLTTRRERHTPRLFKDLTRLNEHLKTFCPDSNFIVHRNQALPPTSQEIKEESLSNP